MLKTSGGFRACAHVRQRISSNNNEPRHPHHLLHGDESSAVRHCLIHNRDAHMLECVHTRARPHVHADTQHSDNYARDLFKAINQRVLIYMYEFIVLVYSLKHSVVRA